MNKYIKKITDYSSTYYEFNLKLSDFIYIKYDNCVRSRHINNKKFGIEYIKDKLNESIY